MGSIVAPSKSTVLQQYPREKTKTRSTYSTSYTMAGKMVHEVAEFSPELGRKRVLLCFGMGWGVCVAVSFVLAWNGPFSNSSADLALVVGPLSCSWFGQFAWFIHEYGAVSKLGKTGEALTVPTPHEHAPALLLASSVVLLCCCCRSLPFPLRSGGAWWRRTLRGRF